MFTLRCSIGMSCLSMSAIWELRYHQRNPNDKTEIIWLGKALPLCHMRTSWIWFLCFSIWHVSKLQMWKTRQREICEPSLSEKVIIFGAGQCSSWTVGGGTRGKGGGGKGSCSQRDVCKSGQVDFQHVFSTNVARICSCKSDQEYFL